MHQSDENSELDSINSEIAIVQINEEDMTYLKWCKISKVKK